MKINFKGCRWLVLVESLLISRHLSGISGALLVHRAWTIIACCVGLATSGGAEPIIYTFSGTGTGFAGTLPFTDAPFRIRLYGETTGVTQNPISGAFSINGSQSTIDIANVGSGTFLANTRLFLNQPFNTAGFALSSPSGGSSLLVISDLAFGGYDLRSSFGPVTVARAGDDQLERFREIPSTIGPLSFIGARDITFSAAVVPEPSALVLLGGAIAAFIFWKRQS